MAAVHRVTNESNITEATEYTCTHRQREIPTVAMERYVEGRHPCIDRKLSLEVPRILVWIVRKGKSFQRA